MIIITITAEGNGDILYFIDSWGALQFAGLHIATMSWSWTLGSNGAGDYTSLDYIQ